MSSRGQQVVDVVIAAGLPLLGESGYSGLVEDVCEWRAANDDLERTTELLTLKISRKVLVFVAAAVAVVATGVGIAAWSTSGSGNGYAKAATASALTLSDASASTSADLYPGATSDVKVKVTNPNLFPIKVTSVTLQAAGVVTSDKGAACNAATGVTFTDKTGLSLSVAAGATATLTVPAAAAMSNASDNSCQGAIFTIPVNVTAISDAA